SFGSTASASCYLNANHTVVKFSSSFSRRRFHSGSGKNWNPADDEFAGRQRVRQAERFSSDEAMRSRGALRNGGTRSSDLARPSGSCFSKGTTKSKKRLAP